MAIYMERQLSGIARPDQADLNDDHRGDPCNFDVDLDTVHDRVDNCRTTQNTDQSDLDADGTGDACDPDIDGDGIRNVKRRSLVPTQNLRTAMVTGWGLH